MAKAFAEKGMNLALADVNEAGLAETQQLLTAAGAEVQTYTLDITDRKAVVEAVGQAKARFGGINIVCANAGVSGVMDSLENIDVTDWDWIVDVNIKGSVYTVQACIPYLLEDPNNAHIVITSSISGLRVYEPSRGQGMYNTTKFAMVGFGEALHVDLAPKGVGVSILCPGVVNTDISNSLRNRPERYGGAVSISANHDLAKAAASGTDPFQFGRWVVKAVEENRLFVITHPQDRELVAARHDGILKAFDDSTSLTSQ